MIVHNDAPKPVDKNLVNQCGFKLLRKLFSRRNLTNQNKAKWAVTAGLKTKESWRLWKSN